MIKIRLAAQMGHWQAEHNEQLLVTDLADRTGLNRDFLYRFYNDAVKRLDLDKLEQLCKFFGCTPNDLLWVEGDEPPTDDSPVEYHIRPSAEVIRES